MSEAMGQMSEGSKKMRLLLRKSCEAAGDETLARKILSMVPVEVLDQMAKLVSKEVAEAERQRCAKLMRMTSAELLLAAGEMTGQELRTVKAVLGWKESQILKGEP